MKVKTSRTASEAARAKRAEAKRLTLSRKMTRAAKRMGA